jgi:hypothetical protein
MNHHVYLVCLEVERFISAKHLYLVQQPDSGLSRLVVDVSRSHTTYTPNRASLEE